jgi:uncharacterized protein (DUF302 family)
MNTRPSGAWTGHPLDWNDAKIWALARLRIYELFIWCAETAHGSCFVQALLTGLILSASPAENMVNKNNGIIDISSKHSVDQTVDRLKNILQSKGVTLFALIDHSGEAEKVGMKMPPTKLLVFGNPRAGTPLMLAAPSIAIDLPLKILVWQDGQGKVWLSYNSAEYLKERHGLPQNLLPNVAVVETLAANAAE